MPLYPPSSGIQIVLLDVNGGTRNVSESATDAKSYIQLSPVVLRRILGALRDVLAATDDISRTHDVPGPAQLLHR